MATLGNSRRIYLVSGSGSATYTWLAGEQNNNVNLSSNKIEVSDKSTDWQQFIAGTKGATISASVFTDYTSSGPQQSLLNGLKAGTTVKVFVGVLKTSSTPTEGMAADCIIDSIGETNNVGEVSTRDIQLTITGEPTFYPTA
jgi:Phage major tail protein 2.